MKTITVLISLFLFSVNLHAAEPLNLNELLDMVKQSGRQDATVNREREKTFLEAREAQEGLLAKAKAELARQRKAGDAFQAAIEKNEDQLTGLETRLKEKAGDLGEMFGVVRQAAGDIYNLVRGSLVSAQFRDRAESLKEIADSKELPGIDGLEYLWYGLMQEMTESGRVVRFPAPVIAAGGITGKKDVIRIGGFTAIAQGRFLGYSEETNSLFEYPRQPERRYRAAAGEFMTGGDGLMKMVIDPTRGSILGLIIEKPTPAERIAQGGIIGYIIIGLGIAGLVIALVRIVVLSFAGLGIKKQLKDIHNPRKNNAFGRILTVYRENKGQPTARLESRIDEAALKEIPKLQTGQSIIKLLAAVAPLLGLLGTVTGMITTFQSITLFGTGDPKLMAGGISQALVTTMLGLTVAIPLLFAHSFVASRSKILSNILEQQSIGLISEMERTADNKAK